MRPQHFKDLLALFRGNFSPAELEVAAQIYRIAGYSEARFLLDKFYSIQSFLREIWFDETIAMSYLEDEDLVVALSGVFKLMVGRGYNEIDVKTRQRSQQ